MQWSRSSGIIIIIRASIATRTVDNKSIRYGCLYIGTWVPLVRMIGRRSSHGGKCAIQCDDALHDEDHDYKSAQHIVALLAREVHRDTSSI